MSTTRHAADIVVVGGGPTGVAAAWRAARAGQHVVLVEAADHLGGLAASVEVAGQRVDIGSHRLHPECEPRIMAALTDLLGDELIARPRHGRIRLAERWVGFPLRPLDLVRHAPPRLAAGFLADLARRPWQPHREPADFAEGISAALGPTMAEHFYLPYARKLFGTEPHELGPELVARRVSAASPGALVRRVLRGSRGGQSFWYPRGGFGRITEVLADAGVASGAEIRLGRRLTRVEPATDGQSAEVEVTVGDGSTERIACRLVWSTIPAPALASSLGGHLPTGVRDAVASVGYRSALVVHVVLDQRQFSDFDAHYLPGADTPVTRISEPAHYRDEAGLADHTVLCVELPGRPEDPWWTTDAATAGAFVADAVEALGLGRVSVLHTEVRVVPHLYPVYRRGSLARARSFEQAVDELGPVVQFGRQALFAHDNTHHGLEAAWAAADSLRVDGTFDRAAWAERRAGFDTHVVAD